MQILRLTVEQKRLSSAEAELWVVVETDAHDQPIELRGSLSGPRCAGVETVQLAYPLRTIRPTGYGNDVMIGRIVIPEPNCWTAEMPFVYDGSIEIWGQGKCVDRRPIRAIFKIPP